MLDIDALNADFGQVGARLLEPKHRVGPVPLQGRSMRGPAKPDDDASLVLDIEIVDDWISFQPPRSLSSPLRTPGPVNPNRRSVDFGNLPGNDVHDRLRRLDAKLSPARGLRLLTTNGDLVPVTSTQPGRGLLIVHGTFSNSDAILAALKRDPTKFLGWALHAYDHILTYDYATTSQPAITSAMVLARLMRTFHPGDVDVVSHSQGGLVTRFWLECFDRSRLERTRAVFIAGTLAGTSLAAPASLRATLDYFANVGWVLRESMKVASLGIPLYVAIGTLLAILEKSLKFLSKTPIIDAGIALVPGLVGMSRANTNAELLELRAAVDGCPNGYSAVIGDFDPSDPSWALWRNWKTRLANKVLDRLFDGRPNDLIVDTESQSSLSDTVEIARTHKFESGKAHVHHTNYFEQDPTLKFIKEQLTQS